MEKLPDWARWIGGIVCSPSTSYRRLWLGLCIINRVFSHLPIPGPRSDSRWYECYLWHCCSQLESFISKTCHFLHIAPDESRKKLTVPTSHNASIAWLCNFWIFSSKTLSCRTFLTGFGNAVPFFKELTTCSYWLRLTHYCTHFLRKLWIAAEPSTSRREVSYFNSGPLLGKTPGSINKLFQATTRYVPLKFSSSLSFTGGDARSFYHRNY